MPGEIIARKGDVFHDDDGVPRLEARRDLREGEPIGRYPFKVLTGTANRPLWLGLRLRAGLRGEELLKGPGGGVGL